MSIARPALLLWVWAAGSSSIASGQQQQQQQQQHQHCSHGAESVALQAARICGAEPLEAALEAVRCFGRLKFGTPTSLINFRYFWCPRFGFRVAAQVEVKDADAIAARALAELGFRTTLDMQVLRGAPEAEELIANLRERGVAMADRAKVRLLIGGHQAPQASQSWPDLQPRATSGPPQDQKRPQGRGEVQPRNNTVQVEPQRRLQSGKKLLSRFCAH
eukprot:SAG31_NODE_325_length_17671_cov_9.902743_14_plen_218_part_00